MGISTIEAHDRATALKVLQSDTHLDLMVTDAGRALRRNLEVLFITGSAENALIGNGQLYTGMQVLTSHSRWTRWPVASTRC